MLAKTSENQLSCHRCKQPLAFRTREVALGKEMQIYQCETCRTLEAFEPKPVAESAAAPTLSV
jgi:predicted SprT family Zn-dependent metalloprotease